MTSVKTNVILNGINTITGILFPVVTFPYAARILLPEGIGSVNFLNSIIGYIIILTSLGIPMYAVKEIAQCRDNVIKRNKITVEIISLSAILNLIGYVIVFLLAKYVPEIHEQKNLFYILSLSILFTTLGVNWFYQGIEDFKFITIRAIIVRTLAAISLFVFVKNSSDLLIYGSIIVGSTVGNNFINFIHLRKYINYREINFKGIEIIRHLSPTLKVFTLTLIVSLYLQLNSIMLGFISGDKSVGLFTAGTKITHIGLTIITSLGVVLLPRCSNLIKNGDFKGFNSIILKSINLTIAFSLPLVVGLIILAEPITLIFCGKDYYESIYVLYLNAPVILIISLTNILGTQILYPMNKIKQMLISVSGGAIVNLILNLIFIPLYGAIGAATSTLIAEVIVLILQLILGRDFYPFKINNLFSIKYILSSFIMGVVVYFVIHLINSNLLKLVIALILGIIAYFTCIVIFRDKFLMELIPCKKIKIIKRNK